MGLLQCILVAFIVDFRLTSPQPHNQIINEFQNLFDAIGKSDTENSEIYRNILKQEVAKEQQAFHALKEELHTARNRNSNKNRNFHERENAIAVKRKIDGLADASSPPSDGSKPPNPLQSPKREKRSQAKARGPKGRASSKKTAASNKRKGRVTASRKSAPRSHKAKAHSPSRKSKEKHSKSEDSDEGNWSYEENYSSAEDDWDLEDMSSDDDIMRIATEHTSTTVDDYEWEPEDDWDAALTKAEKENRTLFDMSLNDHDASGDESTNIVEPTKQKTTRHLEHHQSTTSPDSHHVTTKTKTRTTATVSSKSVKSQIRLRGFEDAKNKSKETSPAQQALVKAKPHPREFEDSASAHLEGAETVEAEEVRPEDFSISYFDVDEDYSDDEMYEEHYDDEDDDDDDDTGDDDDYTYEDQSEENESGPAEYSGEEGIDINEHKTKPAKTPNVNKEPLSPSKKRKIKLKKKLKWVKEQKRVRKTEKKKRKMQSIHGQQYHGRKDSEDKSRTRSKGGGGGGGDQSRYTRLGFRRMFSGRHLGRNAGRRVYYVRGRKVYAGPRKKVSARGKAKVNAKIYKPPKTNKR